MCYSILRGSIRFDYIFEGLGRNKGYFKCREYLLWMGVKSII